MILTICVLLQSPDNSLFGSSYHKSPYYPGKTTFGGAAAHRKSRQHSPSPYQVHVHCLLFNKTVHRKSRQHSPSPYQVHVHCLLCNKTMPQEIQTTLSSPYQVQLHYLLCNKTTYRKSRQHSPSPYQVHMHCLLCNKIMHRKSKQHSPPATRYTITVYCVIKPRTGSLDNIRLPLPSTAALFTV